MSKQNINYKTVVTAIPFAVSRLQSAVSPSYKNFNQKLKTKQNKNVLTNNNYLSKKILEVFAFHEKTVAIIQSTFSREVVIVIIIAPRL
jgi:hypothetical protein